jgi:hypothetical protein
MGLDIGKGKLELITKIKKHGKKEEKRQSKTKKKLMPIAEMQTREITRYSDEWSVSWP